VADAVIKTSDGRDHRVGHRAELEASKHG
jgi:hypothetical protein